MSKEKITRDDFVYPTQNHQKKMQNFKNEQYIIRDFVYSKIITLINEREKLMLGPEKTKTASFIANNYIEVYKFLNKLIKSNSNEGEIKCLKK